MELKIIHTADIHFDTAFSGLSDVGKASVRRQDLRNTFSRIISLAQNADVVFISGDLFDGKAVSQTTLDFLKREFAKIPYVKVFIAAGNHDCFDANSVYANFHFGENVHVFGTQPEVVETEFADIYGVSFQSANEHRILLPDFNVKNPEKLNLLVLHGNVAGEGYNPVKVEDLEKCGMDYVALGHIHLTSGLQKRGMCYYAYPGCPEGRGFDETGEKGVLALSVSKAGTTAAFVPTCERIYHNLFIDVSSAEYPEDIAELLQEKCSGNQHIYRFHLTGESHFPIDTQVLESQIDAFEVFVLDETTPKVDVSKLSEEFTLKGLYTKFALEEKESMNEEDFRLAFQAGFSLIEKEERNENR